MGSSGFGQGKCKAGLLSGWKVRKLYVSNGKPFSICFKLANSTCGSKNLLLDVMLFHHMVCPSSLSPVPIYLHLEQTFLSEETTQ